MVISAIAIGPVILTVLPDTIPTILKVLNFFF